MRKHTIKLLQCGMLAALAAPVMAQVTVEEIEYEGWANSIEIANPDVRVVVVPAIGRIMHYGLVGGENILWSDPKLHGQVLPDGQPNVDGEGQYTWTNFGGDKVMAEFFRRDGTQSYPDGGLSAEVYTCPDYTELELLSPWVYLQVGETLMHEIAWELHRLPAVAETPQARRQAAVEWLATRAE